jgi:hypothetical protein
MTMRGVVLAVSFFILGTISIGVAYAWTGPTAAPPGNNVPAPINVGSTDQVKNGGLGLNSLAVFGNSLLGGSYGSNAYLNFGETSGSSGYGIRDNAGTLEFKNDGGSWDSLQNIVYDLSGGGGGSGSWASSGSNIYNSNSGNVGINTSSPDETLDVNGTLIVGNRNGCSGDCQRITFRDLSGNPDAQVFEGVNNNLGLSAGSGGFIKFVDPTETTPWVKISSAGMSIGMPYVVPDPTETLDVYGHAAIMNYGHLYFRDVSGVIDGNIFENTSNSLILSAGSSNHLYVYNKAATSMWADFNNGNLTLSGTLYPSSVSVPNTQRVWFQNSGGSNDGAIWEGASGNLAVRAGGGGKINFASNSDVPWAYVDSAGVHNSSDARLKKNIEPIASSSGLSAVEALRPVTFNWVDPASGTAQQTGFIAQEVQKVLPNVVSVGDATPLTPDGTLSINYNAMIPSLVKSIQEQQAQIKDQQAQIEQQQQEISDLKSQVAALQAR